MQNASSAFGAFLDPVADKLMVATVLVLMCTQPLAAGPLAGNNLLLPVCTMGTCVLRQTTLGRFLYRWPDPCHPCMEHARTPLIGPTILVLSLL